MKTLLMLFACFFLSVSCNRNSKTERLFANSELIAGDYIFNDNMFGKTRSLVGQSTLLDTVIFRLKEPQMLVKDKHLIIRNLGENFLLFKLPDIKFQKKTGKTGSGPNEFTYPLLVPTASPSLLCYIYEWTTQKLYSLDNSGEITPCHFSIFHDGMSNKQVVNIGQDDFIYAENTKKGRQIYRSTQVKDSIITRELIDLAFDPSLESFIPYQGNLAVNVAKNRMVYAYMYYKKLMFMDLNAETVKSISYKGETEFDAKTISIADGLDLNVTHYWRVYGGEKFVYALHIGRKPVETMERKKRGKYETYIEKYDWDGNPICKYMLDQFGVFAIDEGSNRLYLLSFDHDDPLFVYKLN